MPEPIPTADTPQPGDILLFYNARGLNKIIAWFTRSPYYHVALYAGELNVVEARPRGVVQRNLRSREGGRTFVAAPAPQGKGREALDWAQTQIGAPYDRFDIVIIVLERLFRHLHLNYTPNDRYSCGEFVARAYQQAGVTLFPDRDVASVVPGDFSSFVPTHSDRKSGKRVPNR